ncbi:AVEN family protein [Megaselia abdita]
MRSSRKVLPQNPRSYEIPSDDFYQDSTEDNEQLRADSFQLLESAPLSIGGHFTFSSEKKWDDEETLQPGYFSLNVKFLNAALDTIPLYKKLENSSIPFNKEEIARMDKSASFIEKSFNEKFCSITSVPKPTPPPTAVPKVITPSIPVTPEDNELDELLNMTTTNLNVSGRNSIVPDSTPAQTPVPSEVKSDIQEWLDNVLEE